MHKYLASVGFSEIRTRKEVTKLIKEIVENYDEKFAIPNYDDGTYVEYIKYYSQNKNRQLRQCLKLKLGFSVRQPDSVKR